jgi:hypothetical protein
VLRGMRRVNSRVALGAILGLLLALPVAWLLRLSLYGPLQPFWAQPTKLSPVLTSEERKRLSTYERQCSSSTECEPPLGCLPDVRYRTRYCTDSECVADTQCPEGQVCRVLTTLEGPWVRRCAPLGIRKEGERCYELPSNQEKACSPGLLCAGDGWCSRPCRRDVPASCPDGFFCAALEPEPACLPTCEARSCPPGQECIRTEKDGGSVCAVVHGSNCQQTPCPSGHRCEDFLVPQRPGEAWVRCAQRCGHPGDSSCSEGNVCFQGSCERLCSSARPEVCGVGFTCLQFSTDAPWLCRPEWYRQD